MDLIGYALLWGFMFPSNGKTLKEQTQLEVKRLDLHLKKPHFLTVVKRLEGTRCADGDQ